MNEAPVTDSKDLLLREAKRWHAEADRLQTEAQERHQESEALWRDVERIRAMAVTFENDADRLAGNAKD